MRAQIIIYPKFLYYTFDNIEFQKACNTMPPPALRPPIRNINVFHVFWCSVQCPHIYM